jgi:hypothetical protein
MRSAEEGREVLVVRTGSARALKVKGGDHGLGAAVGKRGISSQGAPDVKGGGHGKMWWCG